MNRFDGRTVVVTGAASGIGYEMARLFAAEGAVVYAADRTDESRPGGTRPVHLDVTDESAVRELMRTVVDDTGRLDVLCNNAGIGSTADPVSCTAEEWRRVFDVNALGVFLCTKYALPPMLAAGRGSIVNTASAAASVGLKDRAAYCASKGAVVAFTRAVAVQYAGTGVRCNCVSPGTVDSPWVARLLAQAPDAAAAHAQLTARQPMGRLGQPTEIAKAALYLASDDADYVTGTDLVIDGGLLAG
ncbi:SDR family NAD(P)-dependent oxidoreductase [Jiangella rhizosphaerae]|uniref:SDR family oxidoreductase n=1 Tax=Jiangella rhizosphaerae TaxID=2293569 RepID=A0A418KM14_9ACTN|nr:SDR family oxidoreductase [Jiangella rhizosphaerae]RIQ18984.1 SDR family oxidoreductase [Jiangella rhizosphaerae]